MTENPTFNLRSVAEEQTVHYDCTIEALRMMLYHLGKTMDRADAEKQLMGLVHSLTLKAEPCPSCAAPGAVQTPIAAVQDGALHRVDYHCATCGHDDAVWWEEAA